MGFGRQEDQLELFDLANQPVPRPQRESLGRVLVHLRHDQLILAVMAGVIGVTVVFACGVERGKELVRSERALLARRQPATAEPQPQATKSAPPSADAQTGSPPPSTTKLKAAPPPVTPKKIPTRVVSSRPRFAIQLVTFSRPTLAKQELGRLKARGERAFLVIRNGRTSVYAGPFPSKDHATEKVALLKSQYRDCFVRTL